MRKALLLIASIATLSLTSPSFSQGSNDAKQLAAEVVELTASDSLVQSMRQSMTPMFAEMQKKIGTGGMNEKQREIMQKFMAETMDYLMGPEYMGKVRVAMVDSFAQVYTVDELRGIRDFYRSPAGAAMLAKTPQAMAKAMPVMQSIMGPMMDEMKARSERLHTELQAAK